MKKETNTIIMFYGITPLKLCKLLEELGDNGWPNQDEYSAGYILGHTGYVCDTEKKFIKGYLKQENKIK